MTRQQSNPIARIFLERHNMATEAALDFTLMPEDCQQVPLAAEDMATAEPECFLRSIAYMSRPPQAAFNLQHTVYTVAAHTS